MSLRTLSAERAPVGIHLNQFPVSLLSLTEALVRRLMFSFFAGLRKGLGFWEKREEVKYRVLGEVGFGIGGNVSVGKEGSVEYIVNVCAIWSCWPSFQIGREFSYIYIEYGLWNLECNYEQFMIFGKLSKMGLLVDCYVQVAHGVNCQPDLEIVYLQSDLK